MADGSTFSVGGYCTTCGYSVDPLPGNACYCCGTIFGLDDVADTPRDLRIRWLLAGAFWWSKAVPQPAGWDPIEQLRAKSMIGE